MASACTGLLDKRSCCKRPDWLGSQGQGERTIGSRHIPIQGMAASRPGSRGPAMHTSSSLAPSLSRAFSEVALQDADGGGGRASSRTPRVVLYPARAPRRKPASARSTPSRRRRPPQPRLGLKTLDLAEWSAVSPHYSPLSSSVPRFRSDDGDHPTVGSGAYDPVHPMRPSVEEAVRSGRHVYSSMRSSVRRFADMDSSPGTADLTPEYDVDAARGVSIAEALRRTPLRYHNVSSPLPRFRFNSSGGGGDTGAGDLGPGAYDATSTEKYMRVRTNGAASFARAGRDDEAAERRRGLNAHPHLGPGRYADGSAAETSGRLSHVRSSPSISIGRAARWRKKAPESAALGPGPSGKTDGSSPWLKRGFTMSQTQRSQLEVGAPETRDHAIPDLDALHKESLAHRLARRAGAGLPPSSPFNCSGPKAVPLDHTRGVTRISAAIPKPTVSGDIGPGSYRQSLKRGVGDSEPVSRPSSFFLAVNRLGGSVTSLVPSVGKERARMTQSLSQSQLPRLHAVVRALAGTPSAPRTPPPTAAAAAKSESSQAS